MIFILPDILLVVLALSIFVLDLLRVSPKALWNMAWIGLSAIFVLLNTFPAGWDRQWLGTWELSNLGLLMREFFVLSSLLLTLLSKSHFDLKRTSGTLSSLPEYLFAVILVTCGSITVVSAKDLLTLFVGLELATIPLYFLVAWNKQSSKSSEASTKYVLMGSASTAMMLFGISYLFGFAGSLRYDVIQQAVMQNSQSTLLWISAVFIFVGIGFKLTLFPFHTWAPDVYEGAPTPVTAFLSVSSKATAIAFLMVLLYGPLASVRELMEPLILLLAGATMLVGNLGALRQTQLKRFMAWSSIAQAGYILTALSGAQDGGKPAIVFYLFVYALSNYLMFWIISAVGTTRPETFTSLHGLAKRYPALGAMLAVTMFSLAGIPPVAGFLGKFFLFGSAASAGHYAFLVFAGLNSTISLYYYLQVLRAAYVTVPAENQADLNITVLDQGMSFILTLGVLAAGIAPWISNNIHAILQFGR